MTLKSFISYIIIFVPAFSIERMVSSEVTLQILATLSGAALVSLVLLAFINTQDKSRISKPDADSNEVNVWQLFSGRFAHLKTSHHLKSENTTESPRPIEKTTLRQLHWVEDERHHIRHGHHKGLRRGNHPEARPPSPPPLPSCYTGNEVLAIVGLTCLLNFAFVLLVMACVHYCSSNAKADQLPRLESVVIESETESDDSRRCWEGRNSLLSLHHLPLYRHKTPSHSMEQLLFVD